MVGDSVQDEIEVSHDRDWFAVELVAGREYRIDLEGVRTGAGTLPNAYLHGIRNADGVLIDGTTDDNSGIGVNSRVTFTPESTGTYYVVAGGWGYFVGTYTLSVTDVTDGAPDDFAAGITTTGAVTVGGEVTGEIETSGDRDWFAVELVAGTTYLFNLEGYTAYYPGLEGDRTEAGTLSNPYLHGIHDANGVLIAGTTDDNGGEGFNSRVTYTPGNAGTYYVAAGAVGDGEGTYTLSVDEVI